LFAFRTANPHAVAHVDFESELQDVGIAADRNGELDTGTTRKATQMQTSNDTHALRTHIPRRRY
jgi:hypothetical protein